MPKRPAANRPSISGSGTGVPPDEPPDVPPDVVVVPDVLVVV